MLFRSAYAQKLLEKAWMAGSNPCQVPMEPRFKLSKKRCHSTEPANVERRNVGSLQYLVQTRPDLTFAAGFMSRFIEGPTEEQLVPLSASYATSPGPCDSGVGMAEA